MCIICPATVWAQLNFLGLTLSELCSSGVWFMNVELSGTCMKDDQKQGFWWAAGSSLSFLCMERREQSLLKLHLHICHLGLSAGSKTLHSNKCLEEDPKFLESTNFPSSAISTTVILLHTTVLIITACCALNRYLTFVLCSFSLQSHWCSPTLYGYQWH